jgi:putative DNA primase/helicase
MSATPNSDINNWSEPEPLRSRMPVDALTSDMIPAALRTWVIDIAERMGVVPEMVAVPALAALGSLIGKKTGVCPKSYDNWLVFPAAWGYVVAEASSKKTPAQQAAFTSMLKFDAEDDAAFKGTLAVLLFNEKVRKQGWPNWKRRW